MKRAGGIGLVAVKIGDAILILAGTLAAQTLSGLTWSELSDTQRGAIALHCAFTMLLLPGQVRSDAATGGGLRVLSRTAFALACASALTVVSIMGVISRGSMMSTHWLVQTVLVADAVLLLGRTVALSVALGRGDARRRQRRVAIVGATAYGRAALDRLQLATEGTFVPVCVFDNEAAQRGGDFGGVPVIGEWSELMRRIRDRTINEVWVTLPMSHERRIRRIVCALRGEFVEVRFLPDLRGMVFGEQTSTDILGMPAINLTTTPNSSHKLWTKFAFDRLFAIAVLLPLLPLLAMLAVAVKLSSPGPVLFRQRRKGVDGCEFEILKFRTMRVHRAQPGVVQQASRNDSRITAVGAFLRRTSLDELPQFFNVLFGQMSVVGPRPHAIEHDDFYRQMIDSYMYRYRVRPGITGWAQVNGYRGETRKVEAMAARVKFDLFYMQNWSFGFDMKIILLTIVRGFIGRNAF
ncbi:undecaprenyl-phosphate glucose phosphotransferase [Burkholderia seminalis]|nr:undecaprenyl-phosphate glucose phosphotransferase [Burkholderia seminalis]MCA8435383.1 undecaprenyl-phosphate glucose phosphotransferase [Burkholderia seminalis]